MKLKYDNGKGIGKKRYWRWVERWGWRRGTVERKWWKGGGSREKAIKKRKLSKERDGNKKTMDKCDRYRMLVKRRQ